MCHGQLFVLGYDSTFLGIMLVSAPANLPSEMLHCMAIRLLPLPSVPSQHPLPLLVRAGPAGGSGNGFAQANVEHLCKGVFLALFKGIMLMLKSKGVRARHPLLQIAASSCASMTCASLRERTLPERQNIAWEVDNLATCCRLPTNAPGSDVRHAVLLLMPHLCL